MERCLPVSFATPVNDKAQQRRPAGAETRENNKAAAGTRSQAIIEASLGVVCVRFFASPGDFALGQCFLQDSDICIRNPAAVQTQLSETREVLELGQARRRFIVRLAKPFLELGYCP
jgi:hypothetical protein